MIFCGIFDGHGPWGHLVAKRVRDLMPSSLLCNWQEETLAEMEDVDCEWDGCLPQFDIWKKSYLKTCSAIDQELEHHSGIDSFHSGTTALTIVRQVRGNVICIRFCVNQRVVRNKFFPLNDEKSEYTSKFKPK